jgi:hypothetical protein
VLWKHEEVFNLLIEKNLFHYHFQPIIDARSGTVFGYEALMRTDPMINMKPLEVIDVANNLGKYDSWDEAFADDVTPELNDIIHIKDTEKETYSIYICINESAETFKDKFELLKDGSGVVSLAQFLLHIEDENIHITDEERVAWNKKVDTTDFVAGSNISVSVDEDGKITIACTYELPIATADTLGGVKVGTTLNIDSETGVLDYNLPTATNATKGGIVLGDGLVAGSGDVVESVAKTKSDISVSKAIGYLKIGDTISAGTTLDDFLAALLQTYVTPVIQSVSVSVEDSEANTATNPAEIGQTVYVSKISYSFDGSYAAYKTYLKPNTLKFYQGNNTSGTDITDNGEVSANSENVVPSSGNLTIKKKESKIELVKGLKDFGNNLSASQSFCVSCGYLKEDKETAGTITKTGSVTWQYAYFYGVLKNDAIPTGSTIRTVLTKKLNPVLKTTKFTLTANKDDKIVCFAYPKIVHGVGKDQTASSILALDSMSSEVKTAFTYVDITLALNNGEEVAYTLAYLMPDGGFTQQARYEIYI